MNELDKKRNRLQHIITRRRPTLYCLESVEKPPYNFAPPLERVGRRGRRSVPHGAGVGLRRALTVSAVSSVLGSKLFWNIPNKPFICRPFTSGTLAQALYRRHSPNYGALPTVDFLYQPGCTLNGAAFSRHPGLSSPRARKPILVLRSPRIR